MLFFVLINNFTCVFMRTAQYTSVLTKMAMVCDLSAERMKRMPAIAAAAAAANKCVLMAMKTRTMYMIG